jgi:hypothetical protein
VAGSAESKERTNLLDIVGDRSPGSGMLDES